MFTYELRSRARTCHGQGCSGCDKEWEACSEDTACSDTLDVTETTPWVNTTDHSEAGGWEERRWTFTYTALASSNKVRQVLFLSCKTLSSHNQEEFISVNFFPFF